MRWKHGVMGDVPLHSDICQYNSEEIILECRIYINDRKCGIDLLIIHYQRAQ